MMLFNYEKDNQLLYYLQALIFFFYLLKKDSLEVELLILYEDQ